MVFNTSTCNLSHLTPVALAATLSTVTCLKECFLFQGSDAASRRCTVITGQGISRVRNASGKGCFGTYDIPP